jgi:hypothetical protein
MKPYYEQLLEKYERQRKFKLDQRDEIAVLLLDKKISETKDIIAIKKEELKQLRLVKSEKDHKPISNKPKYAYIHKVSNINKMVANILNEYETARNNDHVLMLKVWALQNPNLREVYTSFTDFAEALCEGHYVSVNEILKAKESLINN